MVHFSITQGSRKNAISKTIKVATVISVFGYRLEYRCNGVFLCIIAALGRFVPDK